MDQPDPGTLGLDAVDLAEALEGASLAMHWVGPDGRIGWANAAELALLGYAAEEYVGHHIAEFHADGDVEVDILHRLEIGEPLRRHEARLLAKDGSIRHVLLSSDGLRRSGARAHALVFTQDITERRRTECELRRTAAALEITVAAQAAQLDDLSHKLAAAARQLAAADGAKDEFLATVSHELRTPLNAILGWVQLLRTGTLSDEQQARAVETIERNATAQARLIEALLDTRRARSGALQLAVAPVDLQAMVEDVLTGLVPAARAKELRLQQAVAPQPATLSVLGDGRWLRQAVWNLLSNAVKFTPAGGRISVAVQRCEGGVELLVRDSGQGIEPDFLPHVFEPFRQADGTTRRAHGGLGLGLSLVRHLVELHGGRVRAESEGAGRGALFAMTLPSADTSAAVHRTPPAPTLLSPALPLAGLHVLVVDDEPDARELLVAVLRPCEALVSTASDAAEALRLVQEARPDLIVSDIGMPSEDGFTLIRKLRELPPERGGRTPAVALTAYARTEDEAQALRAGFNMHVPKPIEPSELLVVLASLSAAATAQERH
ncbi:MAG: ATP-binding protein [Polyangia bacterium]